MKHFCNLDIFLGSSLSSKIRSAEICSGSKFTSVMLLVIEAECLSPVFSAIALSSLVYELTLSSSSYYEEVHISNADNEKKHNVTPDKVWT